MKVLFILEHYYPALGGVEKLFKSITEGLANKGYEVTVLTLRSRRDLPKNEIHNGVNIRRLHLLNRFFFTFFSFHYVLRYAKNCDIIHTTSYNAALPAYFAARLCRKRIIITFHEVWGKLWFRLPFLPLPLRTLFYLYESFILKLNFDKFIAVSGHTKKRLVESGIAPEKIKTIYNGIDYKKYSNGIQTNKNYFTYTFFGRLGISKGLDLLLDAAAIFNNKHQDAHLKLIIPKRPLYFYRKINSIISKKKIKNSTTILHNLPDQKLRSELLKSNCVVIPSYSEGFCFAAAEAIALRIPLITSNRTALKEVVSGKHINMESFTAEGLADALEKARAGLWNESSIKKFRLSDQQQAYLEMYKALE